MDSFFYEKELALKNSDETMGSMVEGTEGRWGRCHILVLTK